MQITHAENGILNEMDRSGTTVAEPIASSAAIIRSEQSDLLYSDAADYLEYGEG
jgi:hypothetical protein